MYQFNMMSTTWLHSYVSPTCLWNTTCSFWVSVISTTLRIQQSWICSFCDVNILLTTSLNDRSCFGSNIFDKTNTSWINNREDVDGQHGYDRRGHNKESTEDPFELHWAHNKGRQNISDPKHAGTTARRVLQLDALARPTNVVALFDNRDLWLNHAANNDQFGWPQGQHIYAQVRQNDTLSWPRSGHFDIGLSLDRTTCWDTAANNMEVVVVDTWSPQTAATTRSHEDQYFQQGILQATASIGSRPQHPLHHGRAGLDQHLGCGVNRWQQRPQWSHGTTLMAQQLSMDVQLRVLHNTGEQWHQQWPQHRFAPGPGICWSTGHQQALTRWTTTFVDHPGLQSTMEWTQTHSDGWIENNRAVEGQPNDRRMGQRQCWLCGLHQWVQPVPHRGNRCQHGRRRGSTGLIQQRDQWGEAGTPWTTADDAGVRLATSTSTEWAVKAVQHVDQTPAECNRCQNKISLCMYRWSTFNPV